MPGVLKKLNDEGIRRFADFLRAGASENAPMNLLNDPETSEPFAAEIRWDRDEFSDRYEFGCYLNELLRPLDTTVISHDRGLWTALALIWLDQICPIDGSGRRKVGKEYRYVLSPDYRHYYRHLVRTPWQLIRDHGENSKFLLLASGSTQYPLSRHGDIIEQLAGRQQVLGNQAVIAAANRLYGNPETGAPVRGVAGSGPGSVRRLGMVLRQLDLTFDPESMPEEKLISILPKEFDRYRNNSY